MTNIHQSIVRLTIAFTILTAGSVQAGVITGFTWHSGVASLASTTIITSVPGNDNVAGTSPNDAHVTQKDYHAIGPVDLTFTVANNTGGTTEYSFREGVYNNTTLPWVGYHLELGSGFDSTFVKSLPGDGLNFDFPDSDSPVDFNPGGAFFPTATVTEDDIIASGGVMPYLSFAGDFRFSVDVPNGITTFTIRQSPIAATVPEPCTSLIAAIGLAGFALYRRRDQQ